MANGNTTLGFDWDSNVGGLDSQSNSYDFFFGGDTVPLTEQLQRPLHGLDPLLLGEMESRGFDTTAVTADPERGER